MSDKKNERVKNEKMHTGVALEVRRARAGKKNLQIAFVGELSCIHSRRRRHCTTRARKVHVKFTNNNHGCQEAHREEDRRQEARREEAGRQEAGRQEDDRQEDDRDEEEARGEEEAGGEEEARGEEEAGWYVERATRACFLFSVSVRCFYIATTRMRTTGMHNPIPRMHPFLFRVREFSRTHFKLEFALVVRRCAHRVSLDAEDEDERDDEGVMERA